MAGHGVLEKVHLWCTLEDAASITNPAKGSAGTKLGTATFAACKFGNGIDVDANGESAKWTGEPASLFEQGALEAWLKPTGWSIVNGVCSDGLNHRAFSYRNGAIVNDYVTFRNTYNVWVWSKNSVSDLWTLDGIADLDVPDAGLTHALFVWNRSGILGGANTRRIYVNGGLAGSRDDAIAAATDVCEFNLGSTTGAPTLFWNGVLGNLKVWTNAARAIEHVQHRETEGFFLAHQTLQGGHRGEYWDG